MTDPPSSLKNESTTAAVTIHPFDPSDYLSIEKDPNRKSLHFIRHAEGRHNVDRRYRDLENLDAPLTELGIDQCRALSAQLLQMTTNDPLFLADTNDILIVTSPMTRCLQTTMHALDSLISAKRPPIVALEHVRETVNFNCDRRRHKSILSKEFPTVDFGQIESDDDPIWNAYEARLGDHLTYTGHRESAELYVVAERGRRFMEWLQRQSQSHVIVCTHSAFLRCLKNYGYGVPAKPIQTLDDRGDPSSEEGRPDGGGGAVLRYDCADFGSTMKKDYANCELRSMIAMFGP
jgi:broad specificity phosphatase PhoE